MNIRHDGSKGRLVYEMAVCCGGPHRPKASTSDAVQVKNPFDHDKYVFVSVLNLPFAHFNGRRDYHVSYLLNSHIQDRIRKETGCFLGLCGNGDEYDFHTQHCNPYVFVVAGSSHDWQGVDRAVSSVKDIIIRHMESCTCSLR